MPLDKVSQQNMVIVTKGPWGLFGEQHMTASQFNRYQARHTRARARRVADAKKSTRGLMRRMWSGSSKPKKKSKGKGGNNRKNLGFGLYWE
jgi:hypothetical protein